MGPFLRFNAAIVYLLVAGIIRRPRIKLGPICEQMVRIGVDAMPMASLTAFSIGLTLAMQAAHSLRDMGATVYVPDLVAVSLLRELGPLIVAIIVIGRSGSAVTAELGTMKVGEEIEALEVMAVNPMRYLILPRFLAMLMMLPVLTVFGNYVGMAGGWLIGVYSLNFQSSAFISRLVEAVELRDLYSGMLKSVVFAWLIITIACYEGLAVSGGAEGVGRATTGSVVYSLLAVLVANAILTALFFFF